MSVGFSSGYRWRLAGSDWGVLVWASRGVTEVTIDARVWVIAPHQFLWIPRGCAHDVRMSGRGTLRQVYVAPGATSGFPGEPIAVSLSPLMREVLRRIGATGTLHAAVPSEQRLFELVQDELVAACQAPRHRTAEPRELPMPTDARARRAADAVRSDLSSGRPISAIAREAHASVRTLERLFRSETGLSFGAWRRRAGVIRAMTLLADGTSVTAVGLATGYASTSAFVAAFKRDVGVTPGRYAVSTRERG